MPERIRVAIVDDEPPARKLLRALLAEHPEVEIVGEAGDVATAAALCAEREPDLVFLDIQLPRTDGFGLLPLLKRPVKIVFVTAHDRHAVRAFEVNALDYLLKPVAPARLAATLSRLAVPDEPPTGMLLDSDQVALRDDSGLRLVPVRSITHIEAEDNYTRVHLLGSSPALVRRTLAEWERSLPAAPFLRVDRSLIVRLDAVRTLCSESRDLTRLTLEGRAEPIGLGRRATARLRKALADL